MAAHNLSELRRHSSIKRGRVARKAMLSSSQYVFFLLLLLLSLPIAFLLAPHIFAPSTIPTAGDDIEDLALLRRATLSAAVETADDEEEPKKIAFLFLTNSDLTFAPLWERFFSGHETLLNVYVHADPKSHFLTPPTPSFKSRFVPSKLTSRSSPTLISAARRLIATALLDDPLNAFFALVSQHCIPLRPFTSLHKSLLTDNQKNPKSFIEIIVGDPEVLQARYVARGDDVMLPEVPFEKFRVGSQFFVLARRHAVVVVEDRRLWRKFRLPCLKTREDSCYPEEHYFPTLLAMEDPGGCTGYTLTRVNWTDSVGGHPHTYGAGEVSAALVAELRRPNSTTQQGFMFARKFAPECLLPLMEIAGDIILKE